MFYCLHSNNDVSIFNKIVICVTNEDILLIIHCHFEHGNVKASIQLIVYWVNFGLLHLICPTMAVRNTQINLYSVRIKTPTVSTDNFLYTVQMT